MHPPPLAEPVNASVFRGREVEIPLRASGRTPQPLKFLIRTEPDHGTLGPIRITGPKSASVTYTHDGKSGAESDSFRFAVQAVDSAVSAPAEVSLSIASAPAALRSVKSMDFGKVGVGEHAIRSIEWKNPGGSHAIAKLSVPAPWEIVGTQDLHVPPEGSATVKLRFAPSREGEFDGTLAVEGFPSATVALTGGAEEFFRLKPAGPIAIAKGEAFELELENRSPTEARFSVATPEGVIAPAEVTVAPRDTVKIPLVADPANLSAIEGEVALVNEAIRLAVPVSAPPSPAVLLIGDATKSVDFGKVRIGERAEARVEIRNAGGSPTGLTVELPDDVVIFPDPGQAVLPPGESLEFTVAFHARTPGPASGQIALRGEEQQTAVIPWTAEVPVEGGRISPTDRAPVGSRPVAELLVPEERPPVRSGSIPLFAPEGGFVLVSAKPGTVKIGWAEGSPPPARYTLEYRTILISDGDGPPKIRWKPIPTIRFGEQDGRRTAEILRLPPDSSWFIRVVAWDANNERLGESGALPIISPPLPKAPLLFWLGVAATVIAALGAGAWFLRRQILSARAADRDRIARLES